VIAPLQPRAPHAVHHFCGRSPISSPFEDVRVIVKNPPAPTEFFAEFSCGNPRSFFSILYLRPCLGPFTSVMLIRFVSSRLWGILHFFRIFLFVAWHFFFFFFFLRFFRFFPLTFKAFLLPFKNFPLYQSLNRRLSNPHVKPISSLWYLGLKSDVIVT